MSGAPTPYGDAAKGYLKLGWYVTPVTGKTRPEVGTTGKAGVLDADKVKRLAKSRPAANVGIRHVESIAIDVDNYGAKRGAKTLKAKGKAWGKLPATWTSTARGDDDKSRQHFYRVDEGVSFVGSLGDDVEVIHHDYRYSVVWPSVHPTTGAMYRWYRPDGTLSERPPHLDELPLLPPRWVDELTNRPHEAAANAELERFDLSTLSSDEHDRLGRWTMTAVDGVADDLKALASAATHDPANYRGLPWNHTVFAKATRLAELANADWSSLTLAHARAVVFEHAPRDANFDDAVLETIWASAVKTAGGHDLPMPVVAGSTVFTIDIPESATRARRTDPDTFFQKGEGLLAERLADTLDHDLAIGPDGEPWLYEAGVYARKPDEIERRVVRALGDRYRPAHYAAIRAVILKGRDLPLIDPNPDARYINTRSGMVDWATGVLVPHDPAYRSTVQLPIEYDPAATCPKFDRWLAQVIPADSLELVWEVTGYLLMSGNPFQRAVLLHGDGGNGKSTYLRVIAAMLGAHNCASITLRDITEGKFEVAGLFGKIANIAGDIEAKHIGNTSMFKAVTGGDSIEAQHKYGHPFRFTPWAVPIFSANELWQSADNTDGYLRRWLPLPFPVKVSTLGRLDERELFAEAPGIMAKALGHLRALMERGDFEVLGHAADLKRAFEKESDVVRVWLDEDERVVLHDAGNTTLRLNRSFAYMQYKNWAESSGFGVLNSANFYKRLERLGYKAVKVRGERCVTGIKFDVRPASASGSLIFSGDEVAE